MSFLPAEKDRPRRGPWGRGWVQRWADKHPVQALLVAAGVVALVLVLGGLELAAGRA